MTDSIYIRNGVSFVPTPRAAVDIHQTLPQGNYTIAENPDTKELYFVQVDPFKPYTRVYGDLIERATRITNTFLDREHSTGVLLTGEKGSGKTMMAKTLALNAFDLGYPTILVNKDWTGDKFNNLVQSVTQPAVILIDEYEKVYEKEKQEHLLTLLDGVFPSKKLFILTCNDPERVDSHLKNRPGRIFYHLTYQGLEEEFIREYCADNLLGQLQHYVETIIKISSFFNQFNFDTLKALVEEMNRYNESPEKSLEMLNAVPDGNDEYAIALTWDGNPVTDFHPKPYHGIPVAKDVISLSVYQFDETGNTDRTMTIKFTPADLVSIDRDAGMYTYRTDRAVATFTRIIKQKFSFVNALRL